MRRFGFISLLLSSTLIIGGCSSGPPVKEITGVRECDRFLAEIFACIDAKAPEESREETKQSLETLAAKLQALPDKQLVSHVCNAFRQQSKTVYAALDCP